MSDASGGSCVLSSWKQEEVGREKPRDSALFKCPFLEVSQQASPVTPFNLFVWNRVMWSLLRGSECRSMNIGTLTLELL